MEMLSERFVDDMLRDNHAWRRAMKQCDTQECLAPSTRAAKSNMGPVFRRGCTDNVCSLRFVSTLRASTDTLNSHEKERVLRQRMQGRWNPSTKPINSQRDILLELLQRQLELHGFSTAYKESRDTLLKEQRGMESFYRQQREKIKTLERAARHIAQQQEVSMEEYQMRQKLRDVERRKRKSIAASMFYEACIIATNVEFAERKAIFEEFNEQYAIIVSEAHDALQSITGLPYSLYHSLVSLQRREEKGRAQILLSHIKHCESLKMHMGITLDNCLKAEIAQVIAREKPFLAILQMKKKKPKQKFIQ
ncbi:hypothetical protein MOQ_005956 [Trypanosoma cruzi marinkellei]|uniref:Uncharacterized protein n=1 Tax=Trypanosoma cruzi marinkellei TaxID=85056 RepID=K2MWV4_TRYCR|nr:hypothetical protein MOQ_005956 [Trypanosoma cruzi marinkellei]